MTRLLSFLDQVIRYKLTPIDINHVLPQVKPSKSAANEASIFAFQLKDNSNLIIS